MFFNQIISKSEQVFLKDPDSTFFLQKLVLFYLLTFDSLWVGELNLICET